MITKMVMIVLARSNMTKNAFSAWSSDNDDDNEDMIRHDKDAFWAWSSRSPNMTIMTKITNMTIMTKMPSQRGRQGHQRQVSAARTWRP